LTVPGLNTTDELKRWQMLRVKAVYNCNIYSLAI
jgi:hypothetical protein